VAVFLLPFLAAQIAWVRARRASLALLRFRPHESSTGADVHGTRVRPRTWRADAQYERRVCPVASNTVGDLVSTNGVSLPGCSALKARKVRRFLRVSGDPVGPPSMSRRVRSKFLGICHIRNAEELTSFRQRDPRISQAHIIYSRSWGSSASCASVAHLAAVSHAARLLDRTWSCPICPQLPELLHPNIQPRTSRSSASW
jgi:hypothetical protein